MKTTSVDVVHECWSGPRYRGRNESMRDHVLIPRRGGEGGGRIRAGVETVTQNKTTVSDHNELIRVYYLIR